MNLEQIKNRESLNPLKSEKEYQQWLLSNYKYYLKTMREEHSA